MYNLQYKDYQFVKLFSNKVIKEIARIFKWPILSILKPDTENYILKYYNARSSVNKLDLHIDTYMPFLKVTKPIWCNLFFTRW